MFHLAIRMLLGDRGKYFGIVMGLTLASVLITQQLAIFYSFLMRTTSFIADTGLPDIWVVDPTVQYIEDLKPLQDTQLYRVRGVDGVEWAMPLYRGMLRVRLDDGAFQICNVVGLDDATLIGGPARMTTGRLEDLRRAEGVIVDEVSSAGKLTGPPAAQGGPRLPLRVGDTLELNDHRAVIVGFCRASRGFQPYPVIYTTYSRATTYAPRERRLLSCVLVKAAPGVDPLELCRRINSVTGLAAYTRDGFEARTLDYFLRHTPVPIVFGFAALLGLVIGTAIAGQTFYTFTLENLRHFGTLKAMGATDRRLMGMILLQALFTGSIGYGIGVGIASLFGLALKETLLAFRMPWQLLVITGGAILLIVTAASLVSIRKVRRLEPAVVFRG